MASARTRTRTAWSRQSHRASHVVGYRSQSSKLPNKICKRKISCCISHCTQKFRLHWTPDRSDKKQHQLGKTRNCSHTIGTANIPLRRTPLSSSVLNSASILTSSFFLFVKTLCMNGPVGREWRAQFLVSLAHVSLFLNSLLNTVFTEFDYFLFWRCSTAFQLILCAR